MCNGVLRGLADHVLSGRVGNGTLLGVARLVDSERVLLSSTGGSPALASSSRARKALTGRPIDAPMSDSRYGGVCVPAKDSSEVEM
jgi:hypothetical protein